MTDRKCVLIIGSTLHQKALNLHKGISRYSETSGTKPFTAVYKNYWRSARKVGGEGFAKVLDEEVEKH